MPKRKLISGSPFMQNGNESDSSGECTSKKRMKPVLSSKSLVVQQQYSIENEDTFLNHDSENSNGNDSNHDSYPLQSTMRLPSKEELQVNEEEEATTLSINQGGYDGYQSFLKSFQFFSDEELAQSDCETNVTEHPAIKKKKLKRSSSTKEDDEESLDILDVFKNLIQPRVIQANIRVLQYPLKNLEVIFMEHPASVPINGYLEVSLLAGHASIQGYELVKDKPITVFSQKQSGILSLTSHYSEEEEVFLVENTVRDYLENIMFLAPVGKVKNFVEEHMKFGTSVIVLRELILSPALQMVELYSPYAVSFNNKVNTIESSKYTAMHMNKENILDFGYEYKEMVDTIHKHLCRINQRKPGISRSSIKNEMSNAGSKDDSSTAKLSGFRILVHGPKKSGKSTLLRYLVNSFLNKYTEVFFLDTDPGQTEFTPPGGVSLLKITKPMLGPPFTHLTEPVKMVYTGNISAEPSPPMHMKSVQKLINFFNKHHSDSLLVVNTMGWLTGIGGMLLEFTKKTVLPAVEIALSSELSPLHISMEDEFLNCSVGFERDSSLSSKIGDYHPRDLRDWAIIAYLGQCQKYYLQPMLLNDIRPFCICWDNIAVYHFNKRLHYNRYYEALNCSFVALCHVEDSYILTPSTPDYPTTLDDEPDNDCLGFGLVRAVDEEKHLLYIITPLNINALHNVNAVIGGNVLVPRQFLMGQEVFSTELDYTDESKKGKTETRRPIRNRNRNKNRFEKK